MASRSLFEHSLADVAADPMNGGGGGGGFWTSLHRRHCAETQQQQQQQQPRLSSESSAVFREFVDACRELTRHRNFERGNKKVAVSSVLAPVAAQYHQKPRRSSAAENDADEGVLRRIVLPPEDQFSLNRAAQSLLDLPLAEFAVVPHISNAEVAAARRRRRSSVDPATPSPGNSPLRRRRASSVSGSPQDKGTVDSPQWRRVTIGYGWHLTDKLSADTWSRVAERMAAVALTHILNPYATDTTAGFRAFPPVGATGRSRLLQMQLEAAGARRHGDAIEDDQGPMPNTSFLSYSDGLHYHCWQSPQEGRRYHQALRHLSQVVFELQLKTIRVPQSFLFSYQTMLMSLSVAVPLVLPADDPRDAGALPPAAAEDRSVAALEASVLMAALARHNGRALATPLPLLKGADGFFYIGSINPACVLPLRVAAADAVYRPNERLQPAYAMREPPGPRPPLLEPSSYVRVEAYPGIERHGANGSSSDDCGPLVVKYGVPSVVKTLMLALGRDRMPIQEAVKKDLVRSVMKSIGLNMRFLHLCHRRIHQLKNSLEDSLQQLGGSKPSPKKKPAEGSEAENPEQALEMTVRTTGNVQVMLLAAIDALRLVELEMLSRTAKYMLRLELRRFTGEKEHEHVERANRFMKALTARSTGVWKDQLMPLVREKYSCGSDFQDVPLDNDAAKHVGRYLTKKLGLSFDAELGKFTSFAVVPLSTTIFRPPEELRGILPPGTNVHVAPPVTEEGKAIVQRSPALFSPSPPHHRRLLRSSAASAVETHIVAGADGIGGREEEERSGADEHMDWTAAQVYNWKRQCLSDLDALFRSVLPLATALVEKPEAVPAEWKRRAVLLGSARRHALLVATASDCGWIADKLDDALFNSFSRKRFWSVAERVLLTADLRTILRAPPFDADRLLDPTMATAAAAKRVEMLGRVETELCALLPQVTLQRIYPSRARHNDADAVWCGCQALSVVSSRLADIPSASATVVVRRRHSLIAGPSEATHQVASGGGGRAVSQLVEEGLAALLVVRHATWVDVGLVPLIVDVFLSLATRLDLRVSCRAASKICELLKRHGSHLFFLNKQCPLLHLLNAISGFVVAAEDDCTAKEYRSLCSMSVVLHAERYGCSDIRTTLALARAVYAHAMSHYPQLQDVEQLELERFRERILLKADAIIEARGQTLADPWYADNNIVSLLNEKTCANYIGTLVVALQTVGETRFAEVAIWIILGNSAMNQCATMLFQSIAATQASASSVIIRLLRNVRTIGATRRRQLMLVRDAAYRQGLGFEECVARYALYRTALISIESVTRGEREGQEEAAREYISVLFHEAGYEQRRDEFDALRGRQRTPPPPADPSPNEAELQRQMSALSEAESSLRGSLKIQEAEASTATVMKRARLLQLLYERYLLASQHEQVLAEMEHGYQHILNAIIGPQFLLLREEIQRRDALEADALEPLGKMVRDAHFTGRMLALKHHELSSRSDLIQSESTAAMQLEATKAAHYNYTVKLLHDRALLSLDETSRRRDVIEERNQFMTFAWLSSELQLEEMRLRPRFVALEADEFRRLLNFASRHEKEILMQRRAVMAREEDNRRRIEEEEVAMRHRAAKQEEILRSNALSSIILRRKELAMHELHLEQAKMNHQRRQEMLMENQAAAEEVRRKRTLLENAVDAEALAVLERNAFTHDSVVVQKLEAELKIEAEEKRRAEEAQQFKAETMRLVEAAKAARREDVAQIREEVERICEQRRLALEEKKAAELQRLAELDEALKRRDQAKEEQRRQRVALGLPADEGLYEPPTPEQVAEAKRKADERRERREALLRAAEASAEEERLLQKRRRDLIEACLFIAENRAEHSRYHIAVQRDIEAQRGRDRMNRLLEERQQAAKKLREERAQWSEQKNKLARDENKAKRELVEKGMTRAKADRSERLRARQAEVLQKNEDVQHAISQQRLLAAQQEAEEWEQRLLKKREMDLYEKNRSVSQQAIKNAARSRDLYAQHELEDFFRGRIRQEIETVEALQSQRESVQRQREVLLSIPRVMAPLPPLRQSSLPQPTPHPSSRSDVQL